MDETVAEVKVEENKDSLFKKSWSFLKVRKAWWMTPIIIIFLLFLLSYLASSGISLASIYAPI